MLYRDVSASRIKKIGKKICEKHVIFLKYIGLIYFFFKKKTGLMYFKLYLGL